MTSSVKLGPKAQARKDDWIKETQLFQRIARDGGNSDTYEELSTIYDQDQITHEVKKTKRKNKEK